MSWDFIEASQRYLQAATRATPAGLRRLAQDARAAALAALPRDVALEPLRRPLQRLQHTADLFGLPDDNAFVMDVFSGDVRPAEELRAGYAALLRDDGPGGGTTRVWLVTDVCTHACLNLLHLERDPMAAEDGGHYAIEGLFVHQTELTRRGLHETLLLYLMAFADVRGAELSMRAGVARLTVGRRLLSLLGFLQADDGGPARLLRLPVDRLVADAAVLGAVRRQIERLLRPPPPLSPDTAPAPAPPGRSAADSPGRAAATPPCAPSKNG